jgi:hypothetical protein
MATQVRSRMSAAEEALASPVEIEALLSKLGPKDRINVEKHLAACDAEPSGHRGKLFRKMACALGTLAPHATKTQGRQTLQFFIPDGKYRMQVFALHDGGEGDIAVYGANMVDRAVAEGILSGPIQPNIYRISGTKDKEALNIESLDGKTSNPQPFYKDMLGWNRKAMKISLPITASPAQIATAEKLVSLAAEKWFTAEAVAK